MSILLRSNGNNFMPTILQAIDQRISPRNYSTLRSQTRPWEDGMLWPSTRTVAMSGMLNQDAQFCPGRWDAWPEEAGTPTRGKLAGFTKDSNGNPTGPATVRAFRASDDVRVAADSSDAGGYYALYIVDPGANTYWIAAYDPGSPDIAGTTVNNLVPT